MKISVFAICVKAIIYLYYKICMTVPLTPKTRRSRSVIKKVSTVHNEISNGHHENLDQNGTSYIPLKTRFFIEIEK